MGAMLLLGSNETHRAPEALLQGDAGSPKPFPAPADIPSRLTVHATPEHP